MPAVCPCTYVQLDHEGAPHDQRPSRTVNLCLEGVGLQSDYPVEPGETVKVTMALGQGLITFRGKVIYVNPSETQGFRFGVSIRDMDKMDKIALTRYIYYFNPSKPP